MAGYIMNFLYIVSIIFIAYYGISYVYLKYIKKDVRLICVNIIDYILNTNKIMKGD